jgi:hypothetical protein
MGDTRMILNKIVNHAVTIRNDDVRRILILYEEKNTNIGDFCIRFDKLKYVKKYFPNASISLNFSNRANEKYYDGMLRNNPYLSQISALDWGSIDLLQFDIIFLAALSEEGFLEFLQRKHGNEIIGDQCHLAVFSISGFILRQLTVIKPLFPVHQGLVRSFSEPAPGELYILEEEQAWGRQWLRSQGLQEDEQLYILLDSTTRKEKLIRIDVYLGFLTFLLGRERSKVLIFDERNIGKEEFYRELVGPDNVKKILFSKSLTLRQDLSLIGSGCAALIFGPCTGLMHCASSIYNNYVNKGMPVSNIPLMITYTGRYLPNENNAMSWWGNSPLVNCLLLRRKGDKKEMVVLNHLPEEEKNIPEPLPCSEYTAPMLIGFVKNNIPQG